MSNATPSRRQFLSGCAALGAAGASATLANLFHVSQAVAATSSATDYKALVCVFLLGGNDSYNMLVPLGGAYGDYLTARGTIAVPEAAAIPIGTAGYAGRTFDSRAFGLHPALGAGEANGGLSALYADGCMAMLANVGTLIEPVRDVDDYQSGARRLPDYLFAHNHQQLQWQTADGSPGGQGAAGWGGRLAQEMVRHNANGGTLLPELSMNISLSGQHAFLGADSVIPYTMSASGIERLALPGAEGSVRQATLRRALLGLLGVPNHLMGDHLAATKQRADNVAELLSGAYDATALDTTLYPAESSLGAQLQAVARMIDVSRNQLGVRRQIYLCTLGGWDTHADQNARQGALLAELGQALHAFHASTRAMGIGAEVTTFTASDFGRSFNSNGDGSDHGWGGHQIIVGDAVAGGDLYGQVPELRLGSAMDTGRGRFIPSTAVDQYAATLARWFGATDLATVMPNLASFGASDLGFMAG
ncbi:MAG: DUF1501 domain-containing protein [Rhodocyclaceae bacterium]|nr:DUF1501 domain-containing protein [Rhodocyclaceae bacterium]